MWDSAHVVAVVRLRFERSAQPHQSIDANEINQHQTALKAEFEVLHVH